MGAYPVHSPPAFGWRSYRPRKGAPPTRPAYRAPPAVDVDRLMTLRTSACGLLLQHSRSSVSSRVFSMAITACARTPDELDLLIRTADFLARWIAPSNASSLIMGTHSSVRMPSRSAARAGLSSATPDHSAHRQFVQPPVLGACVRTGARSWLMPPRLHQCPSSNQLTPSKQVQISVFGFANPRRILQYSPAYQTQLSLCAPATWICLSVNGRTSWR